MNRVLDEVMEERRRQDEQWGGPEHDDGHINSDWVGFIGLQLGRLSVGSAAYRETMVKIAALAVSAIESHDRKKTEDA